MTHPVPDQSLPSTHEQPQVPIPSGNQLLGPGTANLVGDAAASQMVDWGIVDTAKLAIDNSIGAN